MFISCKVCDIGAPEGWVTINDGNLIVNIWNPRLFPDRKPAPFKPFMGHFNHDSISRPLINKGGIQFYDNPWGLLVIYVIKMSGSLSFRDGKGVRNKNRT